MRTGLTISALLHLALLVWLFVTLPSTKIESTESMPVDVISDKDLSQIMAGARSGEKSETPKPIVDKVAPETTQVKDPTPKVSDKPEIVPTASPPPPPAPPEPKPEKAEAKPDKAQPQPDEIAEAIKRDEAKKKEEAKKLAEAKKREEAKRREEAKKREQEQFSTTSIESRLQLINRQTPQRQAATGASVNQVASLGDTSGAAPSSSATYFQVLQDRLSTCWNPPLGVAQARDLLVKVKISFKKDGSLAAEPEIVNRSMHPLFQVAAEAALRGIRRCAPYTFMPPAKYDDWAAVEVKFDPSELSGY
jgi:colicin import membrane protein